jgi:hypothetical protein
MLRSLVLTIALIAAPGLAWSQDVYRWVDEDGEVHYGNMVPPEYRSYGWERIGPNGVVLERVERALTPEEREVLRQEAIRQAELEAQQRTQETKDRLLLQSYRSEQDLLDTMEMQVAALDSQRTTIQTSLDLANQRFENLVRRAAQIVREGGNAPAELTGNIENARKEIADLRKAMSDLALQEREIRERFLADLERYRALTDDSAGWAVRHVHPLPWMPVGVRAGRRAPRRGRRRGPLRTLRQDVQLAEQSFHRAPARRRSAPERRRNAPVTGLSGNRAARTSRRQPG